jgi:glycosyltransferase involved in cell wall biosynthesis
LNQDNRPVSVVIPAYNAERFVMEAIKSVFNQSYRPLEILLINDGSRDSTLEVASNLATIAPEGKELRIIDLQENNGAANALNIGFSKAEGDYISWLSADDMFIDSQKVETQLSHMKATGAPVSYFKDYYMGPNPTDASPIEPSYVKIRKTRVLDPVFNGISSLRAMMLIFMNPINGSSIMIDRQCVERWGQFDPVLRNVDADGDLWMRYSLLGLKFDAISGAPLFYRQHSKQTSQDSIKMIHGVDLTRMRILSYVAESGRLEGLLRKFSPFLMLIHARKYYQHCPLSAIFIANYLLSKSRRFDPLTIRYARAILNKATAFSDESCSLDRQRFSSDLQRISESSEFRCFKKLMENREGWH